MASDDEFADDYSSSGFSMFLTNSMTQFSHLFMDLDSPSSTHFRPLPHLDLIMVRPQMLKDWAIPS